MELGGAGALVAVLIEGGHQPHAAVCRVMFHAVPSSTVTLMLYHTAINKHGLPTVLSNVVQHGAVMLSPAFGP